MLPDNHGKKEVVSLKFYLAGNSLLDKRKV